MRCMTKRLQSNKRLPFKNMAVKERTLHQNHPEPNTALNNCETGQKYREHSVQRLRQPKHVNKTPKMSWL